MMGREMNGLANKVRDKEQKMTGSMRANALREKMEDGGWRVGGLGAATNELQDLGKGVGRGVAKGVEGVEGVGKKAWRLGRVGTESKGDSVDVESYETGPTDEGLYYSKHV